MVAPPASTPHIRNERECVGHPANLQLGRTEDRRRHDRMVHLVDQMIDAREQLQKARTERDLGFYKSKCTALDRQIDVLTYELYRLSTDEIALVEAASRRD